MSIPPAKAELVRTLVESAPDAVLARLEAVLGEASAQAGPLGTVSEQVADELRDRLQRDTVLAPIAGLFVGPLASFSSAQRKALWRHMKAAHPYAFEDAVRMSQSWHASDIDPEPYDILCALAAEDLAADPRPEALAVFDDETAARLAGYLALAPIARSALSQLPDWLARMNPERRAAARVCYRDAAAKVADGGPRLFHMMAAALAEPGQILRVISAVMDRPNERYLAASELAQFGVLVLDQAEGRLAAIRSFDPGLGDAAAREAGRSVQRAAESLAELEDAVQLSRDGEWGKRLARIRRGVADAVEVRLKEIERAVGAALPVQPIRYSARLIKAAPNLNADPDPAAVTKALALLAFAQEVRSSADSGGFGALRTRMLETVEKHADPYVEDLLDLIRSPETDAVKAERGRALAEVAAQVLTLAKDEKTGEIVRRRLAAA